MVDSNSDIVWPLRRISAALKNWPIGLTTQVKEQLADFVCADNDNVRIPATALRHLMAHGHFAPAGKIALRKKEIKGIEKLSDDLIAATERRFASSFKSVSVRK